MNRVTSNNTTSKDKVRTACCFVEKDRLAGFLETGFMYVAVKVITNTVATLPCQLKLDQQIRTYKHDEHNQSK